MAPSWMIGKKTREEIEGSCTSVPYVVLWRTVAAYSCCNTYGCDTLAFYRTQTDRALCVLLLAIVRDAGMQDGMFCVRNSPNNENENELALCVVFRGKPTHHRVIVGGPAIKINNLTFDGYTDIEAVCAPHAHLVLLFPCAAFLPLHCIPPLF